jgi:hypothetical protein
MSIRRCLALLGLLGACLPAALAAAGKEESTKSDPKAKDRAEAVLYLTLAHDLEEQGRRAQSPLALITAAEILHKIKVRLENLPEEPKVEVKEGKPVVEEKLDPPPTIQEQEALLLADARSLIDRLARKGDLSKTDADALRTMANRVEKMKGDRGAVGGPKQRNGVLNAGYTHAFRLLFQGQVTAYVRVFGNEKTTLQVTVTDEEGKVCGVDSGYNPGGTWVPPLAAERPFTIRVTNTGSEKVAYRLVTN